SGNGHDAAQLDDTMAPALVPNAVNGKPALRFDGVDDFLDVPAVPGLDITGDIATFAIIRVDDFANFNSIWAKTVVNIPAPTDFYLVQGTGLPQVYRGDGGSSFQNVLGARPVRLNTYALVGFRQLGPD